MTIVALPAVGTELEIQPPVSLRFFRNGIAPPAEGMSQLAYALDAVMGQRVRCLAARAQNYDSVGMFSSGVDADTVIWRFACHTGPVTAKGRARFALLPVLGAAPAGTPYVEWQYTTGLTGAGNLTSSPRIYIPYAGSADIVADELIEGEIEFDLASDTDYRFELHTRFNARVVSCAVFEVARDFLDTTTDALAADTADFAIQRYVLGGPVLDIFTAADAIWRVGHPLLWWTQDFSGDEVTRISATAANLVDQTVTSATSTSRGFPIAVPYSGSIDSANVPVIVWCYAKMSSGSGSIQFRDQSNTTIASLTIASSTANWYYVAGNLTDATNGAETSKIDVLIAGDGAGTLSVYAVGMFMKASPDAAVSAVTPLSWLPHFPDQFRRRRALPASGGVICNPTLIP